MKYLIIGLGNPGREYTSTRHNIGFEILDNLIKDSSIEFRSDRYASIAEFKYKARTLILVKPNTFMNVSGKAVNYWFRKSKIDISRTLVVTDDISLDFGVLRMRSKGSDGGHNGLKDINAKLERVDYPRLRFGIGSDFSKGRQAEYVLSKWNKEEDTLLPERILIAVEMIKSFCTEGIDESMNKFNGK